jgi:predicted RNA binding protein YcfA (HicA-like mRNA interferase family)
VLNSREIIQLLKEDGWMLARIKGDHHHFGHPSKPGIVTVPHPKKDFPKGTYASMQRQSGLTFRR